MVEPDRPDMTIIPHMRLACWITRAADTHSEYVILFSTITMVTRTRLSVTLICTLLLLYSLCVYCTLQLVSFDQYSVSDHKLSQVGHPT